METSEQSVDPAWVEQVGERLGQVRERVRRAADQAGRDPQGIRLLPVSKTFSPEAVRAVVVAHGLEQLGENKVQEAQAKAQLMADLPVRWSVIGHLQRNKAKDVAAFAHELQSLDSLKLAGALQRRLEAHDRALRVLVQVNTSGEQAKSGVAPEEALDLLRGLGEFDRLQVDGLMTLAVHSEDQEQVRACFRALRQLRDRAQQEDPGLIGAGELSMGMSGDLELAVAEGSTCVRVGQAIFGARSYA